jgi:hypothetical protein
VKIIGFILLLLIDISCALTEKYDLLPEDELLNTRKYVGNFIDYCYTGPGSFGWPNTILIRTTEENIYGKISVYSLYCNFQPGERLYIRKAYQSNGVYGYWMYQIENEKKNKVWYKLSEFQDGNNALTRSFR